MKEWVSGFESAASVHEADKGRVNGSVGSQAKCDVRKPIVNGNRHTRKHKAGQGSMGGEGLRQD